ncbi:MAG: threonylcarbamoyl-AMP synthase [Verrucomicrobiales bacterium]|nr:threonylcarbamoyl-AMP synthase [Verrucomicrobiales bacterium]|tara:strand:+ start:1849 stop:2865 length:1017 start_codon:yes stop_codon:yes gene_type:complete
MAAQSPEILPTHTPDLFRAAAEAAADRLIAGEVVALPTETVYGLAAHAFDPEVVAKIYEIKDRPAYNPIIVHVDGLVMARNCVKNWPESAQKLNEAFWPGPITFVLPRSEQIPDIVTAGGATVGIRWPGHPLMREVIKRCGFPLAAPSANPSNQLSPTNAEHVLKGLGSKLRLIVDGGQSQIGIESTVIDLTKSPAEILRPGLIHEESIEAVLGEDGVVIRSSDDADTVRSPGRLLTHYSPEAKLVISGWENESHLASQIPPEIDPRRTWVLAHTNVPLGLKGSHVCVVPHDPEAYARALYAELHRCDEEGAEFIIAESVPDTAEWRGIADRLARAAA